MVSGIFIIGVILFIVLINYNDEPYTIEDHHNDIMKDYDEERWINYQESENFKKQELYDGK